VRLYEHNTNKFGEIFQNFLDRIIDFHERHEKHETDFNANDARGARDVREIFDGINGIENDFIFDIGYCIFYIRY